MNNIEIFEELCRISGADNVRRDVILAEYTSLKIGGKADYMVTPQSFSSLADVIDFAENGKIPYYILGNGTNMLVSDDGFRGIIILIKEKQADVICEDVRDSEKKRLVCGAGCLLSRLASEAASNGLTGLEFASGIPGTVGGAVVMNAGAYGGEIKDVIEYALCMDRMGRTKKYTCDELKLTYRNSIIPKEGLIVLEAGFILNKGEESRIRAEMQELNERRRQKQPLEFPSAGSTFKRPEGYFAGKLIEDAGLRGYSVGDACVSEKHCGFVINKGKATAKDTYRLILDVIERVKKDSGVVLEPEVKLLGFEK